MEEPSLSGAAAFRRDGFAGPFGLFTADECRTVANHFRQYQRAVPPSGLKLSAVTDRFVYSLATHPRLFTLLAELIGESIVLWDSSFIVRETGDTHPWHTDIESSAPNGGFASVWIGLENTCRESALQLIAGSHGFGKTLQEVQHEHAIRRGMASNKTVAKWAKHLDANARLIKPEMTDGDAIVFDGRLWHAGPNRRRHGARAALLLRYATGNTQVRRPDFSQLEWPLRFKPTRVPVIPLRGKAKKGVNELIRMPPMIASQACQLAMPLAEDFEHGWKPYPMFNGATPIVDKMSCHVSVLSSLHTPHPPHSHEEEELLIALQGEAELVISDGPSTDHARTERLRPGSFIYYPAGQHHTIRNPGVSPITYLMLKWRGDVFTNEKPVGTQIFHFLSLPTNNSKPFHACPIFEQATAYLGKLHAHLTTVQPGAGYAPHIDDYDVAIVVLSGQVRTLNQVVKPHGVTFYSAGQPHGIQNVGEQPAQYLVFEFHASKKSLQTSKSAPKARSGRQRLAVVLSRLGLLETARRTRKLLRRPN